MTDQHKENSSDVLQTSAAAAQAVSGAVKTGKAAAQSGAGTGDPTKWQARKRNPFPKSH